MIEGKPLYSLYYTLGEPITDLIEQRGLDWPFFNRQTPKHKGGTMKIQVDRIRLITALEEKAKALRSDVEQMKTVAGLLKKYEESLNTYIDQLTARLTLFKSAKTVDELATLSYSESGKYSVPHLPGRNDLYCKQEDELISVERLVKHLKLSDQKTVEADETADYLKYL